MAREFGQLDSAAWRDDEDWRALPADAQWLYALLVSQADLSAAGVLTLAIGRWQRMSCDMTPDRFAVALAALEAGRLVFVDFDDLELLIRVYARRKTQWGNPRRRAAVKNAALAIHSHRLRTALAVDLSKLDVTLDERGASEVAEIAAALPSVTPQSLAQFSPEGTPERLTEPFDKVTAEHSPERSRAGAHQKPEARSQKPEARSQEADTAPTSSSPASRRGTRIPDPFLITDEMREWAHGERMTDEWIDRVTESFVDYWRAKPGNGGVKLDWPATWRTWLRREADRLSPGRPRAPTQSDRFAGHLQLIERLGEEGA